MRFFARYHYFGIFNANQRMFGLKGLNMRGDKSKRK